MKIKDAVSTALRRMVDDEITIKIMGSGKRPTVYMLIDKLKKDMVTTKLSPDEANAIIQATKNHVQHVQIESVRPLQTVKFVTGTRGTAGNT